MNGRLYRSTTDRMIAGVCGGFGAYLNIDPIIIRLFFVLLTIAGGSGVLLYLLCWIIVPEAAGAGAPGRAETQKLADQADGLRDERHSGLWIGIALVVLGVMFLAQNLNVTWLHWLDSGILWPLLLIAAGIGLMWRRMKGAEQ